MQWFCEEVEPISNDRIFDVDFRSLTNFLEHFDQFSWISVLGVVLLGSQNWSKVDTLYSTIFYTVYTGIYYTRISIPPP